MHLKLEPPTLHKCGGLHFILFIFLPNQAAHACRCARACPLRCRAATGLRVGVGVCPCKYVVLCMSVRVCVFVCECARPLAGAGEAELMCVCGCVCACIILCVCAKEPSLFICGTQRLPYIIISPHTTGHNTQYSKPRSLLLWQKLYVIAVHTLPHS